MLTEQGGCVEASDTAQAVLRDVVATVGALACLQGLVRSGTSDRDDHRARYSPAWHCTHSHCHFATNRHAREWIAREHAPTCCADEAHLPLLASTNSSKRSIRSPRPGVFQDCD